MNAKMDARRKYNISFDLLDLKSFKRSAPNHGWAYIIFILKDGTTFPALHFHNGGSKALLKELEKFIHIRRLVFVVFIEGLYYSHVNRTGTGSPQGFSLDQNLQQKWQPHRRAYLSEKGGLGGKKVRRMGQNQKRIRQRNRTRQKNKRGDIEKCDQTDSPEIPDKGETSKIPGLPSGVIWR